MQLLPPLTSDRRVIDREKSAGSFLPYARHVDSVTVETRDGLLLQTICLSGLPFETADTDELNYRAALRDAMLRTVGNAHFAIYHHVVRREVDATLDGQFPDPFSRSLNDVWRARLSNSRMYANELFLTVIRRPLQGRIGVLDRMRKVLGAGTSNRAASIAVEKRELDAAVQALMASLSHYAPRLLKIVEEPDGLRSEVLEFLSTLYNDDNRSVRLPFGDLGQHLPARRISFGQDAYELAPNGDLDRRFGAIISIKDYPAQTLPGMFDELYRLPFPMTVTQSFAFVNRSDALGRMNLALRRMRSSDDEAISLRDELARSKDDVAAGRAGFGEHHCTISLLAPSLEALHENVAEIMAALADLGITGVREDIALEPAYWAQFPGNFKFIARPALVSTANFAGLASLHNFSFGRPRNNHWGDAVTLFETTAAGPYFFNFHRGDLGNFTVIGPSGSGKTVVLNFLLAQARRFSPRIIFFDKDRGAELFMRAIGGQYDRLHPGMASGLNPLQLNDAPENRQFLHDWLAMLAGGLSVEEGAIVQDAIDANFVQLRPYRRLRHFVEMLRGHDRPKPRDLSSRLAKWWGDGSHAWLFDNEQDGTDLSAMAVGFDMTAILDDPDARTPALAYLFHRVEERLDGKPTIIVVDEGWKALDDDVFVLRIKDWEKTIRKKNGIVGFATQSAQDALESRVASAIVEQAATQIFMVNAKARAEDYVDGFGLTEHELDLLRSIPDNAHSFLVKSGAESAVVRLNLTGESDLLKILSGREDTVRTLDALIEDVGEAPEDWMPALLGRV